MIESFDNINEVSDHLEDTIGKKLTRYISGLDWDGNFDLVNAERLRCALRVTLMIEYAFDKETAKAWLLGKNSRLQDQSPAYAIRNGTGINDYHPVVVAATVFCLPKFI